VILTRGTRWIPGGRKKSVRWCLQADPRPAGLHGPRFYLFHRNAAVITLNARSNARLKARQNRESATALPSPTRIIRALSRGDGCAVRWSQLHSLMIGRTGSDWC